MVVTSGEDEGLNYDRDNTRKVETFWLTDSIQRKLVLWRESKLSDRLIFKCLC
jgi:hypothetical protein